MKTIKIKNININTFAKLINYPMKFQKGRIRNNFVKILKEKFNTFESGRIELIESLSKKDADGKSVMDGNMYQFSDKNKIKFNEEFTKLSQEEAVIDILPSLEEDVAEIKQMINNSPVELNSEETDQAEEIITSLNEGIPPAEKKNKKKNITK